MTRDEQIKEAAIGRYGNNGNESQYMLAKIQAFMVGGRYADEHPNGSLIKWQTGEPPETGMYLVTVYNKYIATDYFGYFLHDKWRHYDGHVTAWCKLSDIQPYKGKEVRDEH